MQRMCFFFYFLHFATTLRVLKPVLRLHMKSFNYGATEMRWVKHADAAGRSHRTNIMPDSIFSVNTAQCITCSYFFFCFVCVFGVLFLTSFTRRDKVLSFLTFLLVGWRKTLRYNG